jgi:hypothetical protein
MCAVLELRDVRLCAMLKVAGTNTGIHAAMTDGQTRINEVGTYQTFPVPYYPYSFCRTRIPYQLLRVRELGKHSTFGAGKT